MITEINGEHYRNLLDYGLRNLRLYRQQVNELNVFPVPDGDTGSNMVLTLENGINAIKGKEGDLVTLAHSFANSVIFGARGNSGVILSQFLKGFSEYLCSGESAGCREFVKALEAGVKSAYEAVAVPVEGTMLTVSREGTDAVSSADSSHSLSSINDVVDEFLRAARASLKNTPELLPVLKSAGVIDSGGAGLVYIFEGMNKYLNNESISDEAESGAYNDNRDAIRYIDYSKFNSASRFPLGYCTEILLQLSDEKPAPDPDAFKDALNSLGTSIVTSFEADKVKVHIHTHSPERMLSYCHGFGEFLSVKIENMSVQHSESSRFILSPDYKADPELAVVAVSHDSKMRDLFFAMGADVVIDGSEGYNPSAKDFHDAFNETGSKNIFVFPNSKNSVFAAEQAGKLYSGANVMVLNSRSAAECYSALAMFDFETNDAEALAKELADSIANIFTVTVSRAVKAQSFDSVDIEKGDLIAIAGSRLISVGKDILQVAEEVAEHVTAQKDCSVINVFSGSSFDPKDRDALLKRLHSRAMMTDVDYIETDAASFELLLSFE